MEEASGYLNTHISPCNLISISIFEDDHPCDNNIYHMVILHKGRGDNVLEKKDIQGDIYSLKFYTSDKGWQEMGGQILEKMESDGFASMRYLVGTTNYSDGDGQAFAFLKWSKTHEDALADNSRGGCSCNIF